MPLTENGKINRRALTELPPPGRSPTPIASPPPREDENEIERVVSIGLAAGARASRGSAWMTISSTSARTLITIAEVHAVLQRCAQP
jgi:hypothetical protein